MKKIYLIVIFTLMLFGQVFGQTQNNTITRRIFETYSLIEYNIDSGEYMIIIFDNADGDGILRINLGNYHNTISIIGKIIEDISLCGEGTRCYYNINNVVYQPYILYNQYREKSLYFVEEIYKYDISYDGLKRINKQIAKINKKYGKN